MFTDKSSMQTNEGTLLFHINDESNVLMYGFQRCLERFAENINKSIDADKSHQVVATVLGIQHGREGGYVS